MGDVPEHDLVARARRGDRGAFGALVRVYQARVRAYAARFVSGGDDVHDIAQDSFVDAYLGLGRFDPARPFWPWLRAICRNRILNHYRQRSRASAAPSAQIDEALAERLEAERDEPVGRQADRLEALRVCMEHLNDEHRQLLRKRYHDQTPVNDIAASADRTATSISQMLIRIRQALMKCIQHNLESVQ